MNVPSYLKLGNSNPDVVINPRNSIILEMKATELIKTSKYATTYTLRFPRIKFIRDDKNWDESCTLEELNKLSSNKSAGVQKIAKRFNVDDIPIQSPKKSKRQVRKPVPRPAINPILSQCNVIDNICDSLEFCVLSTIKKNIKLTIPYLKNLILSHGGKIAANPGKPTYAVIAGDLTLRLQEIIAKREYNVVSVNWLLRALDSDDQKSYLLPFHPRDMLSARPELEIEFKSNYDQFYDSYIEKVTEQELKTILSNIEVPSFTKLELYNIEEEILGNGNVYNIFRLFHGIFYKNSDIQTIDKINLSRLIFEARGGTVEYSKKSKQSKEILPEMYITHIFVDRNLIDKDFNMCLTNLRNIDVNVVKIIDYKWIFDCDKSNKVLPYKEYLF